MLTEERINQIINEELIKEGGLRDTVMAGAIGLGSMLGGQNAMAQDSVGITPKQARIELNSIKQAYRNNPSVETIDSIMPYLTALTQKTQANYKKCWIENQDCSNFYREIRNEKAKIEKNDTNIQQQKALDNISVDVDNSVDSVFNGDIKSAIKELGDRNFNTKKCSLNTVFDFENKLNAIKSNPNFQQYKSFYDRYKQNIDWNLEKLVDKSLDEYVMNYHTLADNNNIEGLKQLLVFLKQLEKKHPIFSNSKRFNKFKINVSRKYNLLNTAFGDDM